jgi:hypothetical protein
MCNVIEVSEEEPFAKGQNSRDVRVCYDARYLETQFMDAIDTAYDFFRFLQASTRGAELSRNFKDPRNFWLADSGLRMSFSFSTTYFRPREHGDICASGTAN